MHTFYLSPRQWEPSPKLSGQEAHHLSRVLRLRQGETILLLNGVGRTAVCSISSISRQCVSLTVLKEAFVPRPKSGVVLAAGWGREARRSWLLEKAVELEAQGLWFWQAERSQFPVPADIKEAWRASLVAGAKQSQNPWLPELRTLPGGVEELIHQSLDIEHRHVLVEHRLTTDGFMDEACLALPGRTLCVIGPEGGFTDSEAAKLRNAGFHALSMGRRILRWETAALMALGLHWWKRQGQESET
ncbi:16S rRNA (uracil(1498)-N(3))-methyltransferase [uncultured Mailhella sp.]|uniref:16S rRNA (uracil(1498)-N(3))-methyltransferase n=1 Tax=uncultured Mailhella sp. TaxID=1981031 RepID=UPI00260E6523|nr:16S rRNA (uracil(1498)-N(3))-methyltransferase [uncultured Mailhella sp.]